MKTLTTMTVLSLSLLVGGSANASGIMLDENALSVQNRASLHTQIAQARASDPDSFRSVADLVGRAKELNTKSRGGHAPIALYLHRLGDKALLPMLELLVLDPPSGISSDAIATARLDLVEAVGLGRDVRAMPALLAMLDRDSDYATARTVSEAVARMESDDAVSRLTSALTKAQGERSRGILAGMGSCHREAIATALGDRLTPSLDDQTAIGVIRSLGNVGNAWAWKTLSNRTEESKTREIAARALVAAFSSSTGDRRQAASNALMVVDYAGTPALIDASRSGASPATLAALDDLAARFANNPSRTH